MRMREGDVSAYILASILMADRVSL
ncbi:hypothetical protein CGLO_13729 [Colletotrichum gloeosporioides Cg-14]|uniref:Uncharacterized protein n=1 Tax=Colletotrichum gloeosporioides (strain Cg-14) TaxID=1237896 RepID=T0L6H3_COLGC|nr:hypothetical protein CGLO_13729 [Colletotrichum gloeosporioides Cg-14]